MTVQDERLLGRSDLGPRLFAWSGVSVDDLGEYVQLGGPASYGGAVLAGMRRSHGLEFVQAVNVAPVDVHLLPGFLRAQAYTAPIPHTVRFRIRQEGSSRTVEHVSPRCTVAMSDLGAHETWLDVPVVVVSPIVNEFHPAFFASLATRRCEAIFLDLFNNDNGSVDAMERDLLSTVLGQLAPSKNVFLKLSEPEFRGVESLLDAKARREVKILLTRGDRGASLLHGDEVLHVRGESVTPVEPLGAGDVFLHAFAAFYALQHPLPACLDAANRIAAWSVTCKGPTEPPADLYA